MKVELTEGEQGC